MFLLFSKLMLVSWQQNCLIFRSQLAKPEGRSSLAPFVGKKEEKGLCGEYRFHRLSAQSQRFPRCSAVAVLQHAPTPGQMLQHLQLTAERRAAAGTGSRVQLIIRPPLPSSHSPTPVGQKGQAKRDIQPESPEWGQHGYWQRYTTDPRELIAIWCIDWIELIISQMPLMSSFNQFGVCLHF